VATGMTSKLGMNQGRLGQRAGQESRGVLLRFITEILVGSSDIGTANIVCLYCVNY
jgi:hypothetical protein